MVKKARVALGAVAPTVVLVEKAAKALIGSKLDDEALAAFHELTRTEGIMPALESSHALAYAATMARQMDRHQIILVNLSGRGDKDMHTVAAQEGLKL